MSDVSSSYHRNRPSTEESTIEILLDCLLARNGSGQSRTSRPQERDVIETRGMAGGTDRAAGAEAPALQSRCQQQPAATKKMQIECSDNRVARPSVNNPPYIRTRPRRAATLTASVRLVTPSFSN